MSVKEMDASGSEKPAERPNEARVPGTSGSRSQAFQLGHSGQEPYPGESPGQHKRRLRLDSKLAAHEAKYPSKADPFAGIPQADDYKF